MVDASTVIMGTVVLIAFLLLPLLAGGFVRVMRPGARWLLVLLSFSGAFLLGVVFLHMLPELYAAVGHDLGFWVLGGFLLQVVLEFFSRGIEHGHMHTSLGAKAMPLATLASLCVHSFVEGIPFADATVASNLPFLAGVLMHKMPMAIALATVLQRSGSGHKSFWSILFIFALAAPVGILAGHAIGDGLGMGLLQRMLGLAIGMLLHIGTTIIFESAPEHRVDRVRSVAVLLGALLAAFSAH